MQPKPDSHSILPLSYADWLFRRLYGTAPDLDLDSVPKDGPTVTIPDALVAKALRHAYSSTPLPDVEPQTLGDDPGGDPPSNVPVQPPPATLLGPRYTPIGKAARRKEQPHAVVQAEPAEKLKDAGVNR